MFFFAFAIRPSGFVNVRVVDTAYRDKNRGTNAKNEESSKYMGLSRGAEVTPRYPDTLPE